MIPVRWAVTIEATDDEECEAVRRKVEGLIGLALRSDGYLTRGGVRYHVFVAAIETESVGIKASRRDLERVCEAISPLLSVSGPNRVTPRVIRFSAKPWAGEASAGGVRLVTLTIGSDHYGEE